MKFDLVLITSLLTLVLVQAEKCTKTNCQIKNNCRCSNDVSPFPDGSGPQLVALTFDESIFEEAYKKYWKPLLFNRKNPDGRPISGTFFVPHEYTDYRFVNDLWLRGFEIGVNSISKYALVNYWSDRPKTVYIDEFKGQRQILNKFARIPMEHIQGVRPPQLQLNGDISFDAFKESGLIYDNSMPTSTNKPLFPYTLDYESDQDCLATKKCPKQSHPGFWVLPISDLYGKSGECHTIATCNITGSAKYISDWLFNEVDKVRKGSKQPMTLLIESYLFEFFENSFEGIKMFLDQAAQEKDIFFVSTSQIRKWILNPVPLDKFETDFDGNRTANCAPRTCLLNRKDIDKMRVMGSCTFCPEVYPWVGNPDGKDI